MLVMSQGRMHSGEADWISIQAEEARQSDHPVYAIDDDR